MKSRNDYLEAFKRFIASPAGKLLDGHPVVFACDYPGFKFFHRLVREAIKGQTLPPELCKPLLNVVPFAGPLHFSINSREIIVEKFHAFFQKLNWFIFGPKTVLSPKPFYWKSGMLLLYAGHAWLRLRSKVLQDFQGCKAMEYLYVVNMLENYVLPVLAFYPETFKKASGGTQGAQRYEEALKHFLFMFTSLDRRNYKRIPTAMLSDIEYWRKIGHPLYEAFCETLNMWDDYVVENFHSILRAAMENTNSITAERIAYQARLIEAQKSERAQVFEFLDLKGHCPVEALASKPQKLTENLSKAEEFLTSLFGNIAKNIREGVAPTVTWPSGQPSRTARRSALTKVKCKITLPAISGVPLEPNTFPFAYMYNHHLWPSATVACDVCAQGLECKGGEGVRKVEVLGCGHGIHSDYNGGDQQGSVTLQGCLFCGPVYQEVVRTVSEDFDDALEGS